MLFSSKRGVSISVETLVKLLLLTAFLLIIIGLAFTVSNGLSNQGARKYSCWMTSSLKATGSSLSGIFPSTCSARVIDEALDMGGVALLLRDSWWMYGHGQADYSILQGVLLEEIYEAAKFKVSVEISIDDLLNYLLTHRKGKPSSLEASDYNYLQEDAVAPTVCFDSSFKEDNLKFKPGVDYSLYFADHIKAFIGTFNSDRLVIVKGKLEGEKSFSCYNPLTKKISEGKISEEGWLAAAE